MNNSFQCQDPLKALPLNFTTVAGYCGVVVSPNSTDAIIFHAIQACNSPCATFATVEPCIYISGGARGQIYQAVSQNCGVGPSIHFEGVKGAADWTQCLIQNGLDVYDKAQGIIDSFCVEPLDGMGMRYSSGIFSTSKVVAGVSVGLGAFLLLLLSVLMIVFATKWKDARAHYHTKV